MARPKNHRPTTRRGKLAGFSLVELLIAVVVLGIIATLAVPNMFSVLRGKRIETTANNLAGQLKYARSEAVRSSQPVSVCIANASPPTACGAGTNWANGWIVFQDDDGTNSYSAAADTTNRIQQALDSISITTTVSQVVFDAQGGASNGATFTVVGDDGQTSYAHRVVSLLQSGQVVVSRIDAS